jgi:hypothetical protein
MINDQSVRNDDLSSLKLDLSGLELEDIEVLLQEGSRGMPDFAASTGTNVVNLALLPVDRATRQDVSQTSRRETLPLCSNRTRARLNSVDNQKAAPFFFIPGSTFAAVRLQSISHWK